MKIPPYFCLNKTIETMELVIANKQTSVLVNDNEINLSGTHLQGYIHSPFSDLAKKLGEPILDDGEKVRAEWFIQVTIDNKTVIAHIYDWKEYQPIEHVSEWHIGGFDTDSVKLVQAIFPEKVCQNYR